MRTRQLLIAAVGLAAAAAPAAAHAQTTASRMTSKIAEAQTWGRADKERQNIAALGMSPRWGARVTVNADSCKVVDRRHGNCRYTIEGTNDDTTKSIVCRRRVFSTITRRKPHRIRTRVSKSPCVTTAIPGAVPH